VSDPGPIVIIGGGHAGAQLCIGLASAGHGARVHLVCEEPELPYQRPPLSKSFLKNPQEDLQSHRGRSWFDDAGITVHLADPAVSIDRSERRVQLRSGNQIRYERLVLATGTRARRLPHLSSELANVVVLRSAEDAARLRQLLAHVEHLTVVGGGFIGLEIAASASALGIPVTVLESAPRLLMRSVSALVADHVLQTHRANGINLRLGVAVGGLHVADGRLVALSVDGVDTPVDLLVLGIGAVPEHALASDAGLDCDNGIVVDEHMQSSDPAILAIGDCTSFPEPTTGHRLRLESVQNANDQARAALATLSGDPRPYRAVPWFWSEQGSLRLQMAGLAPRQADLFRRDGSSAGSFTVLHYLNARLACVESVNAPVDHMVARKLLEAGRTLAPEVACDPAVPLKVHL
jgi:3-phenylpropionate/trans-cinnamate dioxygenase ferredoxin reductase component